MTAAICLECGQMKSGAWTPCQSCNYQPSGVEELAMAVILSDNFIALDKLKEFSARRQRGEPWKLNPDLVEMVKAQVSAIIPMTQDGHPASMTDREPENHTPPPDQSRPNSPQPED